MSQVPQPRQSWPAGPPPVLDPGGRATLWGAPRGLTGLQLRTALSGTLPTGLQLAVVTPAIVLPALGAGVGEATGEPLVFALSLVAGLVGAMALQWWALRRKRWSHGMVLLTPLQFDLLVALDQLPAARVDAGRQLHDRLVRLLQQPTRDPAAVQQCELWAWQLVTGR
jgi:hypothetical protein